MSSALENQVRRFYSDWSIVSPRQLAGYFTADAIFQTPLLSHIVTGAAAIAGNIEIFRGRFENVDVEVVHIASVDKVVLCEHVWHYDLARGKRFQVPAQDAFVFADDQISVWRAYFDPLAVTNRVDLGEG